MSSCQTLLGQGGAEEALPVFAGAWSCWLPAWQALSSQKPLGWVIWLPGGAWEGSGIHGLHLSCVVAINWQRTSMRN